MKTVATTLTIIALAMSPMARAADPPTLTQAKLAADLGKADDAARRFRAVADNAQAPAADRWQALLALAAIHQKAGDRSAEASDLERIVTTSPHDEEAMRAVATRVLGVEPPQSAWQRMWPSVKVDLVPTATGTERVRLTLPVPPVFPVFKETKDRPFELKASGLLVDNILGILCQSSGWNFRPMDAGLRSNEPVVMDLRVMNVEEAINRLFSAQGWTGEVVGKTIRIHSNALGVSQFSTVPPPGLPPGASPEMVATLADLQTLYFAFGAQRVDHQGSVPEARDGVAAASLAIETRAQPLYVLVAPRWDAWGHEMRYWSDGSTFVVASAGPDGVFSPTDLSRHAGGEAVGDSDDLVRVNAP